MDFAGELTDAIKTHKVTLTHLQLLVVCCTAVHLCLQACTR